MLGFLLSKMSNGVEKVILGLRNEYRHHFRALGREHWGHYKRQLEEV